MKVFSIDVVDPTVMTKMLRGVELCNETARVSLLLQRLGLLS